MNTPDRRKCRNCGKKAFEHGPSHSEGVLSLFCEDGRVFWTQIKRPDHASQSFSFEEIKFLKMLFEKMPSSIDMSFVARRIEYVSLAKKWNNMNKTINERLSKT